MHTAKDRKAVAEGTVKPDTSGQKQDVSAEDIAGNAQYDYKGKTPQKGGGDQEESTPSSVNKKKVVKFPPR
jgi:hypothetical protein